MKTVLILFLCVICVNVLCWTIENSFETDAVVSQSIQSDQLNDELEPLSCNFEDPDWKFCFWREDPRDDGASWRIKTVGETGQHALCLTSTRADVRRRPRLLKPQSKPDNTVGRLWSHTIAVDQPQSSTTKPPLCLMMQYMITSTAICPSKHGYFIGISAHSTRLLALQRFDPTAVKKGLLDCDFTDSMCKWSNDQNNWPINWRLLDPLMNERPEFVRTDYLSSRGAICLSRLGEQDAAAIDSTSRMFGPLMKSLDQPLCLRLGYSIQLGSSYPHQVEEKPIDSRIKPFLSILRRQMG
ncbi:unnamed protein product [Calicophoron daubneyi]|uniref:MAM domain-containing protein n=1 Tax=Calicophoron daubneyi TaxID=300641 RepID=A0AAV2TZU6_CALDB